MALNIEDIINDLEEARLSANRANQRRYQQGLAELRAGREQLRNYYSQAGSLIQDIGASAAVDINRAATRNFA
ncbi:hypothetical protein, partial [Tritonibacter sp. SIMBA_163]|uniref:hypothetical protein n=1 Tax=Tritonibacter sp. SIMBA_163 TaxID=3080868 RepID=UPI00397FDEE6